MERSGEGAVLLEAWKGAGCVLLIDAVSSGHAPGDLHRIDCHRAQVPHSLFRSSSHTFGVSEAIELGRTLDTLPGVLMLYGIEGSSFEPGRGLSDVVVRSIPGLLAWIEEDIAELTHLKEHPEKTRDTTASTRTAS
jgi:hydrogenase maturation protease